MAMIRKATALDLDRIEHTYTELLTYEQDHGGFSNWALGIYPVRATAERALAADTLYVLEEDGEICASMNLNQDQPEEYADIDWQYPAAPKEVMVIHTLCIPPSQARKGYGREMVCFAQEKAVQAGCTVLRIDTFLGNEPAKALYAASGFRIAGTGRMLLAGVIEEDQVYLEKKL